MFEIEQCLHVERKGIENSNLDELFYFVGNHLSKQSFKYI